MTKYNFSDVIKKEKIARKKQIEQIKKLEKQIHIYEKKYWDNKHTLINLMKKLNSDNWNSTILKKIHIIEKEQKDIVNNLALKGKASLVTDDLGL